jgi:hypothetical protein
MKENPVKIFFNNRLQEILWFKGTVSKDLLQTVKMKKKVYSSIKSCTEYED